MSAIFAEKKLKDLAKYLTANGYIKDNQTSRWVHSKYMHPENKTVVIYHPSKSLPAFCKIINLPSLAKTDLEKYQLTGFAE
jgi:predicted RNA binding protein YcfA (HicA-like mRNA interferase family)